MPTVTNISFSVKFDLTSAPKLMLTDTSTFPTGATGRFAITLPDKYTRTGSHTSPDITSSGGALSYDLRLDSNGGTQCGTYTVVYEIKTTDGVLSTFTRTFVMSYVAVSQVIKENFDVFTPNLSYSDTTNYAVSTFNAGTVTRAWSSVSIPLGTKTGNGQVFSLAGSSGQYYDAKYTTTLNSTLTYQHQTYSWLTVLETISKTVVSDAYIPVTIESMIPLLETLRNNVIECNGDIPQFEKAQSLFTHLVDMLKLVIIGNIAQDGIYDVYNDLLVILHNNQSLTFTHTNGIIPRYNIDAYTTSIYNTAASYCVNIGDGTSLIYNITHSLNEDCVIVQVYDNATGEQVLCDISIVTENSIKITFSSAAAILAYRVVVHSGATHLQGREVVMQNTGTYIQWKYDGDVSWTNLVAIADITGGTGAMGATGATGATGPAGPGLASGGTVGQFIRKNSGTNYDTYWDTLDATDIPVLDMSKITTGSLDWSRLTGTPTTLAGYAIANAYTKTEVDAALANYIPTSQKGVANGVATLDSSGLVPSTQLPSYVDDVLEYTNLASFPGTGATGKIYVALDTNETYRWSGSAYVRIANGAVQTVNSLTGNVTLTTSNVTEGTNKYYTDARVKTYSDTLYASLTGSYSNPSWITGLAWSKITGAPSFLTAEADTLATVVARGAVVTADIAIVGKITIGTPTAGMGQYITASPGAGNFDFVNSSGGGFAFSWIQNNSTAMTLTTQNNLLIGTTTDAGYKLDVNGNARVGTAGIFGTNGTYSANLVKFNASNLVEIDGSGYGAKASSNFTVAGYNYAIGRITTDSYVIAKGGSSTTGTTFVSYGIGRPDTTLQVTPLAGFGGVYEGTTWANGLGLSFFTSSATDISGGSFITEKMRLKPAGDLVINTLAGTGTRMVVADASGVLSTQAIPSGSGGSVTSVAALTIGTTGTDVTSSVATGTTTPVITLNIPDASATARGLITTGTQTIAGAKTFSAGISGGNDISAWNGASTISANDIVFYNTSTITRLKASSATTQLGMMIGGVDYFRVFTGGNIAIQNGGTFTDNGYRLEVTGTAKVSSTLTANSFVKIGGTSAQFLKADGSVDAASYLTSVNISNINATGTASSTTYLRGDGTWGTPAGTGGSLSGSGVSGQVTYWNGTSTMSGTNNLFWDATSNRLGIGLVNPQRVLEVYSTTADSHIRVSGTAPSLSFGEAITGAVYQAKFALATGSGQFAAGAVAGDFIIVSQTGSTIFVVNSVEKMKLISGGQLKLAGYTSTSVFTGTVAGYLAFDSSGNIITSAGGGGGSVTSVSVTTANGISGTVATNTTTPAITLTLGAITPTSVNSVVISGSTTPTLAVTGTTSVSGSNTGDNAVNSLYSGLVSNATHTGDATGSTALTVVGLRGVTLPTLGASAGLLKYTGTGTNTWVFDTTAYLTANQTITLSGAITGSGTTSIATTLAAASVSISNISATGTASSTTFLRGDGSWATPSGGGIALTALSATTPLTYNNTTGVFAINQATTSANGYLTSGDWNTFNGKQNALAGTGLVRSTGGTISYDTSAYLTSVGISDHTATGTPSASTYLRGDNTWATITGGGTISLTTTGSSGAATLVGSTLNIPIYTGGGGSGASLVDTYLQDIFLN